MKPRVIAPEWLDQADPAEAALNLADLRRLNRWFGGHHILLRHLRRLVTPADHFTFLDVGAASGDMGQAVLRAYPRAVVFNLDRTATHLVSAGGHRLVADAFHLPIRRADIVHTSLFLHHFPDHQVVQLLAGMRACAERALIVQDLVRHPVARAFLPATRWLFGWHRLTLHDGPISVDAGFRKRELEQLAREAGLEEAQIESHGLAFRLSLAAGPAILKVR